LEKEVAWLYFYGTCKSCFVLLQEGLYLVLISPFYNHALLGCDVGWEWTRHWVWADGWVSGGCREYSMSYLNFDVFFFLFSFFFLKICSFVCLKSLSISLYIYILIIDVACWQDGVKAEYVVYQQIMYLLLMDCLSHLLLMIQYLSF
jgi:hypothetical protein